MAVSKNFREIIRFDWLESYKIATIIQPIKVDGNNPKSTDLFVHLRVAVE